MAIACWAFAEFLEDDFDLLKLIQLALVHDLGEIDAGDTFLYGAARGSAHIEERECVRRLASYPGNSISKLVETWEEQEAGVSKEARLLKVHQFIEDEAPEIHVWFRSKLDYAVEQGWLAAS